MGELMEKKREITVITAEIRALTGQAQAMVLQYAMEIGRRLCEAKSQLEHGEWGEWLKNEVKFSRSTANNFMRIFEGYSAKQMTFGTEPNVQAFGHLTYSKALALLAVPEEEREEFAEEVKADQISVRELEEKIKAREEEAARAKTEAEEARREAEDAKKEAERKQAVADGMREDIAKLEKARARETEARDEIVAESVERMRKELEADLKAAQEKAKEAEAKAEAARREAEELRKNPTIPKAIADKLRKEEKAKAEAAAKKALTEAEEKLRNAEALAEEEKKKADALLKETGERLAAAEKAAAMSDPDAVLFREIFGRIQRECITAREILGRMEAKDGERAGKFRAALRKVLEGAVG